jgi:hypothetical protein
VDGLGTSSVAYAPVGCRRDRRRDIRNDHKLVGEVRRVGVPEELAGEHALEAAKGRNIADRVQVADVALAKLDKSPSPHRRAGARPGQRTRKGSFEAGCCALTSAGANIRIRAAGAMTTTTHRLFMLLPPGSTDDETMFCLK